MTEIDVSGCEGYKDKHCRYETSIMFAESNLCSNFPNCYYKQLKRLEFENKLLKADYEASEEENAKLKEELNRYKEMEAKGLEEFKDVGGCWGCGLQLQLEQDIKDLKKYGQENVELLQENAKLKEALEEIRKLNSSCADCDCYNACGVCSNAEEKPYKSFKIADEVLKDE